MELAEQVEQRIEERLNQIRGDDPAGAQALIDRLLTSYLRRMPEFLERLKDAVRKGDADTLASEAHSLQGVAANLGVVGVADVCADLVKAGHAGRLDLARGLIRRLRVEQELADRALRSKMTGS